MSFSISSQSQDPLSYTGLDTYVNPPLIQAERIPTTLDVQNSGTQWSFEGVIYETTGSGLWYQIVPSGSGGTLDTLSGNTGIATPSAENILIAGTAPVVTTASGSAVTVSLNGTVATSFNADSGNTTAIGGILAFNGFGDIITGTTTGSGSIHILGTGVTTVNTGSGSATVSSNAITISGTGGITTSGSGSTVTISGGSTGITTLDGNTGAATGSVVTLSGTNHIVTSASGSTVNISADSSLLSQIFADSGTITPQGNTLTVHGQGDVSTGSGSAGILNIRGNGVVTVNGNTGTATAAGNAITISGTGGITTSGSGSTVTITGTGGLTFAADSGSATPSAGTITIAGGNGTTTSATGSTVTISSAADIFIPVNSTQTLTLKENAYILLSGITVTLPPNPVPNGTVVTLVGGTSSGDLSWTIAANSSQSIQIPNGTGTGQYAATIKTMTFGASMTFAAYISGPMTFWLPVSMIGTWTKTS